MEYHFLSGLPRAGSSLLASILCQNPRFHSSIMSPVGRIVTQALEAMGPDNEASRFIDDEQRKLILRGVFDGYYHPAWRAAASTVFDNNRRWTANLGVIKALYPKAKVICCLRDPISIVDSFERLWQRNPLALSIIYGGRSNLTVFDRTNEIMKPTNVVGFSLASLATAIHGPHREMLHPVEYDDLCRFPKLVMEGIHKLLDLPEFAYDFTKIEAIPGAALFDEDVSTPGLHDLKPAVVYTPRSSILPPELWQTLPKPFWRPVKEASTPAR